MISILSKGVPPVTIILVVILVVVLVIGLSALEASCSRKSPQSSDGSDQTSDSTQTKSPTSSAKETDDDIDGGHKSWVNPNAPKDIASTDLLSFFMSMTNDSGDIQGSINLELCVFDENEKSLIEKAGNNVKQFKKSGYMLTIYVIDDRYSDYGEEITAIIPVDKDFSIRFAEAVRASDVLNLNGIYDWTQGLPPKAGEFIIDANYASGEFISIEMNPSIPSEGITLYRSMRPLLLETMLDAGENYVPLLNLDRAFTTPAELIKTIDLRQNHMMITETYIFTLMRFSDRYCLTGRFTDKDGQQYVCDGVEIESADRERLLNAFVQGRYYYARTDDSDKGSFNGIYDETTGSFTVSFIGVRKSYSPIYGTEDESNESVYEVFCELTKKYSE